MEAKVDGKVCFHGGRLFDAIGDDFSRLSELKEYVAADVLDAWYPPAPAVIEVLNENLTWAARTSPPIQSGGLRRDIAHRRNVSEESVIVGAGSSELIFNCLPKLIDPTRETVIVKPCYGEYEFFLKTVMQAPVRSFNTDENDFDVDLAALLRVVADPKVGNLIIVNPCNPTGKAIRKNEFSAFLKQVPSNINVIVDETYIDWMPTKESIEALTATFTNLSIFKSMSKYYALSGMRAGYVLANAKKAESIRSARWPYAVGTLTQIAVAKALTCTDYYDQMVLETNKRRDVLVDGLRQIGKIKIYSSYINAVLLDLSATGVTAAQLLQLMRDRKILLRDISSQGVLRPGNYLRISVLDYPQCERILRELRDIIK